MFCACLKPSARAKIPNHRFKKRGWYYRNVRRGRRHRRKKVRSGCPNFSKWQKKGPAGLQAMMDELAAAAVPVVVEQGALA